MTIPIPVGGLVDLLGNPTNLTVTRHTATPTQNEYGENVYSTTTLELRMVVHQATRKQLERAGLDYGHDWRAFYCKEELRTSGALPADVVDYNGAQWELHNSADYGTLGGMYMALGKLIE